VFDHLNLKSYFSSFGCIPDFFIYYLQVKESLDTQVKKMITKYPYDVDLKNAIDLVQERVGEL
jgi:hypothetical protein